MSLKYLRLAAFQGLTRRAGAHYRRRRMAAFLEAVRPRPHERVLDLGGTPSIWADVPVPLNITLLNLPGTATPADETHHAFTYVEGDACHVDRYAPGDFDVVFSNSVIEHVGPEENQHLFAREVLRLGRTYWVQTPSPWFPIEAHCGMPFWWQYPAPLRERIIRRWRRKLPAWSEMVAGTRVLTVARLRDLFPDAQIRVELALGLPKSYVAFRIDPSRS
jgi:hypothetical protein